MPYSTMIVMFTCCTSRGRSADAKLELKAPEILLQKLDVYQPYSTVNLMYKGVHIPVELSGKR